LSIGSEENEKMKAGFSAMETVLKRNFLRGFNWHSTYTPHENHATNSYVSVPMALKKWGLHMNN